MSRNALRRALWLGAVSGCVAMGLAACASRESVTAPRARVRASARVSAPAVGTVIPPHGTGDGWRVTYPVTLPAGYETVTGLASSPSGASLWVVAQGVHDGSRVESVLEYSAESGALLRTVPLDLGNPALVAGGLTPAVVLPSGVVWVGINEDLVEVGPRGVASTVTLPTVPLATAPLPAPPSGMPDRAGSAGVESLALASDGQVVIGRRFSTDTELLDTATRRLRSVALPAGTELSQAAGDLAGEGSTPPVAVLVEANGAPALATYRSGSWVTLASPCAPTAVSALGSEVVAAGPTCVARVGTQMGATAVVPLRASLAALGPEAADVRAVVVARGEVGLTASEGMVFLDSPTGTETGVVSLGDIETAPSSGLGSEAVSEADAPGPSSAAGSPPKGSASESALGAPRPVPIVPGLLAADALGGLWVVPTGSADVIGHIVPAA